jgi:hypothetical protein
VTQWLFKELEEYQQRLRNTLGLGQTLGNRDNPYYAATMTAEIVGEIRGIQVALEEEIPAPKEEKKKVKLKRRRPAIKKENE